MTTAYSLVERAAPNPTVDEIVEILREQPDECAFVVHMPGGKEVFPGELWVFPLGVWARVDGFSICGDRGRGYTYPGRVGRWRLRRAIKRMKAQP